MTRRDLDRKGQVLVMIRTQARADVDVVMYEQLNARMEALIRDIPGYVSAKGYKSDDGDEIFLVRFASADALRVWREHPEHVAAQERGKSEIYASYDVEVLEVTRAYDFRR